MAIQLEDLVARLRLDDTGFSLSGVNTKLGGAAKKMQSSGRSLTTGLTLPIVGAAVASVKLAGDFDQTMRQVGIATDGSTDKLQDLALQMGAKTAFSAGDAADAMLELAKGGMTAATIQGGALESTMTLAAAGGVSLGDAATYMSNQMNAFGVSAADANSVVVALAGGANASSASVDSLGQGLAQVGGIASAAGLGLDETVAALAALDANGVKGSDAGTSLKTMLTSLIPQTDKAKSAMEELNLSFVDNHGNIDGIVEIAGKLQDKLGDMSEAQRLSTLRTIFGSDAFRAANALVEEGAGGLGKYVKATHDKTTADKLAKSSMEGVNGAVEKAKGSLETAGIVIGQSLAPVVADLAGKVEDAANWFADLDEGQRENIIKAALLAAALGPVLVVTGKLVGSVSTLVSTGSKLVNFMANTGTEAGATATKMQKFAAGARLAAGAGGMLALTDSLRRAPSDLSTLESALGGAAAGAMFGPWGAAVGGAGGALMGFIRQDKAFAEQIAGSETVVGDYAASFDGLTGAITSSTRATAAHALEQSGVLAVANKYRIASGDLVSAVLDEGDSADTVSAQIQTLIDRKWAQFHQAENTKGTAYATAQGYTKEIAELEKLNDAIASNRVKLEDQLVSQRRELEAVRGGTINVKAYREQINKLPPRVRTAFDTLGVDSTRKDVRALGRQYELTPKQVTTLMRALGFKIARDEADETRRHIDDIDKAKPNLARLRADMNTQIGGIGADMAKKTHETGATIGRNLGQVKVSTAWTRPWLGSISSSISSGKSTAASGGASIGFALSQGIAGGITGAVYLVTNAAAAAVQAGVAAARAKADAHSPSRVMQRLGRDMGDGLVLGVDQSRTNVQRSFAQLSGDAERHLRLVSPRVDADVRAGGSVRRSERVAGGRRAQPLRIRLDFGSGRTLDGWLEGEIDGRDELAHTRGRMG